MQSSKKLTTGNKLANTANKKVSQFPAVMLWKGKRKSNKAVELITTNIFLLQFQVRLAEMAKDSVIVEN